MNTFPNDRLSKVMKRSAPMMPKAIMRAPDSEVKNRAIEVPPSNSSVITFSSSINFRFPECNCINSKHNKLTDIN